MSEKLYDDVFPRSLRPHVACESGIELSRALLASLGARLEHVLSQRTKDRTFIDQRVRAVAGLNRTLGRTKTDPFFCSVFGQRDADDRVVMGPNCLEQPESYTMPKGKAVAPLPSFLTGEHVTLFGVADSQQSCTTAMHCMDVRLPDEPAIVTELLTTCASPKWGVDSEDSQTPLKTTLETARANLSSCIRSATTNTLPIKRLPGLGIPCTFESEGKTPMPLHIYDFAHHVCEHWDNPKALVFYFPKLENEEEAAYVRALFEAAEHWIKERHPSYELGTIRVIVVVENARAIFRVNEIMDTLFPYFAGASLGWHDFLASTARLYKEDPSYRIPVKADSTIVIKHVKASHELLARVVGGRGGLAIGGMYGVLPTGSDDPKSGTFQVCLRGFIKDVVTQLKRGLVGFWVARADFVRIGMALTAAFKRYQADRKDKEPLEALVRGLLVDVKQQEDTLAFCYGSDIESLPLSSPAYPRALVVADVEPSSQIANNDPEEVRYNVFQSLQYLADWLGGNGVVALPSTIDGFPVHVLDDLATVERSRWEVWHEVHSGRFAVEELIKIVHEEMNFIRRDLSTPQKIVHVKWTASTARWYPIAMEVLLKLMTATNPPEFVTELLIPLTAASVRAHESPLLMLEHLEKQACAPAARKVSKFALDPYVARFHYFFERCGEMEFAKRMAQTTVLDVQAAKQAILSFNLEQVIDAASFHGNIGQSAASLDKMASAEQAKVFEEEESVREQLRSLGAEYLDKFGVKFLVSAKGKSGSEMLEILKRRLNNSKEQELENGRIALWEITYKRIVDSPPDTLMEDMEALREKHKVPGASLCVSTRQGTRQVISLGDRVVQDKLAVRPDTLFEIASLSKTFGSAFAIEYFTKRGVSIDTPVNELLAEAGSDFRLRNAQYGDKVLLKHLMSHSALNMHYVNGVPLNEPMPNVRDFLDGNEKYGYPPIDVVGEPGTFFRYSGGGFLVLEHLIETIENRPIHQVMEPFLDSLGVSDGLTFEHNTSKFTVAHGYDDQGNEIPGTRKMFPSFAAGALGTPQAVLQFLEHLGKAYRDPAGSGPISHDTAVTMLHGTDKGCLEFMGCMMGIGVFVGEAGPNRFLIHQGANDGFRGVFLHCFDGPDCGAGLVMFANGDNRAMFFIAEAMQKLLLALNIEGIDTSRFGAKPIDINKIKQEEIVNFGYKALVFDAFQPTLPDEIVDKGPLDPLASVNRMVGAKLLKVTNQRFARALNLTSDHLPKFDPELFCPMGKVMDSWETARHNEQGKDEAVFELVRPVTVKYVSFSTKYHYGNQAEFVELYGLDTGSHEWVKLVPKTFMDGHAELRLVVTAPSTVSQVKVVIFPDGGLSRVGLFDDALPSDVAKSFAPLGSAACVKSADPIPATKKPLQLLYTPSPEEVKHNLSKLVPGQLFDAAGLAFGGSLVSVTNQHYGPAGQVFSPYVPLSMHDGFESARSRSKDHHEELVVRLGVPCVLERIELDFTFFVNNNPRSVEIFGLEDGTEHSWVQLVPETGVKAFAGNTKVLTVSSAKVFSQLKLLVYPDGGVNRFRALGKLSTKANL